MPKSLYEWLDQIEARPGMYLPSASFAMLETFIAGYESALMTHGSVEQCTPPFMRFGEFVTTRLKARHDSQFGAPAWQRSIADSAISDGDAFALFFKLLREFRA
jgi:hypothetical protein